MKNKKGFAALLCVLLTAFSITACAVAPPNTQQSSSNKQSSNEEVEPQTPEETALSFVVDENNYTSLGGTYVPADDLTDFYGDYEGNAVQLAYTQENASYQFENPFSGDELAKMRNEYGYTHVSVWIAVSGIQSGSLSVTSSAESPYSIMEIAGYTEYPFVASDNGQWYYISVPITLYEQTLFQVTDGVKDGQYARLMTLQGEGATGEISFYVGDIKITREASVLTVNQFTAKGIWNKDVASTYVSASDETLERFTGGYVGGAKRFKASANVNWRVENYFTLPQLNALKKYYTHVTLWFAFDNLATGKIHLENWNTDKMPKFNEYSTVNGGDKTFVPEDNGVWHSMTVAIDDFITVCTAEDGQTARDSFYLFRVVNKATAKEGTLMQLYIGDIFFE